jgi:hypothetical protein
MHIETEIIMTLTLNEMLDKVLVLELKDAFDPEFLAKPLKASGSLAGGRGNSRAAATPASEDLHRRLQVHTPETLRALVHRRKRKRPELVQGLFRENSLNLLVGGSGLGKTPLAVLIGMCVAAGRPLFGRDVQQGPVLYCDAESDTDTFLTLLDTVSGFLGLERPPENFRVWSPNWEETDLRYLAEPASWGEKLLARVSEIKPKLVVVDPLRIFWPDAETKNVEAAELVQRFRDSSRETGTAWLILHHLRKANQQAPALDLAENPHDWFQEAAGAHGLVNHSDTRLGVVARTGQAQLMLGGYVRGTGPMSPIDLRRVLNDDGDPIGYKPLQGLEHLAGSDREALNRLTEQFRFADARNALGGKSESNTVRFLDKCQDLGLIRKEGREYIKVPAAVEYMEQVE